MNGEVDARDRDLLGKASMTGSGKPPVSAVTAGPAGGDVGFGTPNPELVMPQAGHSPIGADTSISGTRLPFSSKLAYASGQLVELVVGSVLNIFMLFYATVVCGVPGSLAGLAVGAGLVVDAVMDPLIGSLSDGWRSRLGRRVPFMIAALPIILLCFNLIFWLPSGLGEIPLFLLLATLSIGLRVSLSMFTLPYQALSSELSEDYTERSSIAAWRWGIGLIGTIACIILGYGVFLSGPNGTMNREAYSSLTLTLSGLIVVGAVLAIRVAMRTRSRQEPPPPQSGAILVRLFKEMGEVFSNRTFRIIFIASLLFSIASGLNQALGMHVMTFFWHLSAEEMQPMALTAVAGLMVGAPLAAPLARRFEKRSLMIGGMAVSATFAGITVILQLLGLLPFTGATLITVLSISTFIAMSGAGVTTVALLAMVPDAADEHEHIYGTRRDGLYVAGWAFASKAANGAGILIAGIVLDVIGFPADVAKQGLNAHLPAWKVDVLAVVAGPGGNILTLIGLVLMFFYRIDRRTHARIMADLHERRSTSFSESR